MKNKKSLILFLLSFLSIALLSSWLPSLVEQPYASKYYGFPLIFYYNGGIISFDVSHLVIDIFLWMIAAVVIAKLIYKRKI